MSNNTYSENLKNSVSLRQFANTVLGSPAKTSPNGQYGPTDIYYSPDRNERTPSFHVNDTFFKDFGGDARGDIFTFAMRYTGANSFKDALQIVEDFAGIKSDNRPMTITSIQRPQRPHQSSSKHDPIEQTQYYTPIIEDSMVHLQEKKDAYERLAKRVGGASGLIDTGYLSPETKDINGINISYGAAYVFAMRDGPDGAIVGGILRSTRNFKPFRIRNFSNGLYGRWGEMDETGEKVLLITEGESDTQALLNHVPATWGVLTNGGATTPLGARNIHHIINYGYSAIIIIGDANDQLQQNGIRIGEKGAEDKRKELIEAGFHSERILTWQPPTFSINGNDDLLTTSLEAYPKQGYDVRDALSDKIPIVDILSALFDDLKQKQLPQTERAFMSQLPDSLRQLILRTRRIIGYRYIKDHVAFALILEIIHLAVARNVISETTLFSEPYILELAEKHGISNSTARRGLNQAADCGWLNVVGSEDLEEFLSKATPLTTDVVYSGGSFERNNGRPPSRYYWLPKIDEALDCYWEMLTEAAELAFEKMPNKTNEDYKEYEGRLNSLNELKRKVLIGVSTPINLDFNGIEGRVSTVYRDRFASVLFEASSLKDKDGSIGRIKSQKEAADELGISVQSYRKSRKRRYIELHERYKSYDIPTYLRNPVWDLIGFAPQLKKRAEFAGAYIESSIGGIRWLYKVPSSESTKLALQEWMEQKARFGATFKLKVSTVGYERRMLPEEIEKYKAFLALLAQQTAINDVINPKDTPSKVITKCPPIPATLSEAIANLRLTSNMRNLELPLYNGEKRKSVYLD